MGRNIIVAKEAGYCYGVERAIKMVEKALSENDEVYSLGPIIHNPQVVKELSEKGLITVEDTRNIPDGATVIIRSHGVAPVVIDELKKKNSKIIDATCPFVRRAQYFAKKLYENGYDVLVIGERKHPEVIGILGYVEKDAKVASSREEVLRLPYVKKRGVVFQTTQSDSVIEEVSSEIVKRSEEALIFNTICEATTERQNSAMELAKKTEVVVVVGGKNSGNTRRLFDICRNINKNTYWVETADEINEKWFSGATTIGVTAGASTPRKIIDEVVRRIKAIEA